MLLIYQREISEILILHTLLLDIKPMQQSVRSKIKLNMVLLQIQRENCFVIITEFADGLTGNVDRMPVLVASPDVEREHLIGVVPMVVL